MKLLHSPLREEIRSILDKVLPTSDRVWARIEKAEFFKMLLMLIGHGICNKELL